MNSSKIIWGHIHFSCKKQINVFIKAGMSDLEKGSFEIISFVEAVEGTMGEQANSGALIYRWKPRAENPRKIDDLPTIVT